MGVTAISKEKFHWLEEQSEEAKRAKYRPQTLISWDAKFMKTLEVWAEYSHCLKKGVACILARDRTILSTGINGVPKGIPHPISCPRLDYGIKNYDYDSCACVHAEINAIAQAAMNGVSVKGATCYTEYFPCKLCIGPLINAQIVCFVYNADIPPVDDIALDMVEYRKLAIVPMHKNSYGEYTD